MRSRGIGGMVLGLALGLAACGGAASTDSQKSSVASAAGEEPSNAPPPGASITEKPATGPSSGGDTGGPNAAVIAVGSTTYHFAIAEDACGILEGNLFAVGDATDGSGASFGLNFPRSLADWDFRTRNKFSVSTAKEFWFAQGSTPDDQATWEGPRVDSLDVADGKASGTFWVLDENAYPIVDPDVLDKMVSGSFDVSCSAW